MNQVNRQLVTDQEPPTRVFLPLVNLLARIKRTAPLNLIWWCLAVCILCGTLTRYATASPGISQGLLVVLGSGGCAWFWLLSRSLFRDRKAMQSKVVLLVPAVIVIEAFEALVSPAGGNGTTHEFLRVFSNVASLVCIAAIVSVWHEALSGFSKIRTQQERRFRIIFLSVYSIPVAVAVLWVLGAEAGSFAGQWNDTLLTFCAFIGLAGSRLAVEYRLRTSSAQTNHGVNNDQDAEQLASQVLQALKNDALLTQPNLKVADLANHIGAQEYKVTRCITSELHFRNFNHMLNKHRIERATRTLKQPKNDHLNVATIAFDCGFNSLGPFNRAFKQHTGMTPREFRQELRTELP